MTFFWSFKEVIKVDAIAVLLKLTCFHYFFGIPNILITCVCTVIPELEYNRASHHKHWGARPLAPLLPHFLFHCVFCIVHGSYYKALKCPKEVDSSAKAEEAQDTRLLDFKQRLLKRGR